MAILIEGISVVILCRSIIEKVPGGVVEFTNLVPNGTLCSDGELACVSFMTPLDTRNFVEALNRVGLIYRGSDGAAIDIVVVDQQSGPVVSCEWVDFGRADWNNDPSQVVAVCCAWRTKNIGIVAPEGWSYGRSLTANRNIFLVIRFHRILSLYFMKMELMFLETPKVDRIFMSGAKGILLFVLRWYSPDTGSKPVSVLGVPTNT